MTPPIGPGRSQPRTGRGRAHASRGYTLVEALVTVALLVAIATIVVPVVLGDRSRERVDRADDELKALTDALDGFSESVGEWPASLSQLVVPLASGDRDLCGSEYNGGERNRWAGPYLSRPPGAAGLPVGIGRALPALDRTAGPGIDYLEVTVEDVEADDATALEARIDGDDDPTTGAVRWSPAGSGRVTVRWIVPVPAC